MLQSIQLEQTYAIFGKKEHAAFCSVDCRLGDVERGHQIAILPDNYQPAIRIGEGKIDEVTCKCRINHLFLIAVANPLKGSRKVATQPGMQPFVECEKKFVTERE